MALTEPTARNPKRTKRSSASVSVSWEIYDRLDKLATEENAPISKIITGLVDKYAIKRKAKKVKDEAL
tara:strand:- start:434 stop:637 length:204 start_codon:yes stop_codon:yes gene_type:complete